MRYRQRLCTALAGALFMPVCSGLADAQTALLGDNARDIARVTETTIEQANRLRTTATH